MKTSKPATVVVEGRNKLTGRFAPGWKGGPGNPRAHEVIKFRQAMMNAVTEEDVVEIVRAVVNKAKCGDVHAAALFFDRIMGKLRSTVELQHAIAQASDQEQE